MLAVFVVLWDRLGMSQQSLALPMRFGGVEVLVQAVDVRQAGTEETSTADKLVDLYEKAESAIIGVARSVAGTIRTLATDVANPSSVEVEFGLSVSTEGKLVVVTGTVEANLSVKIAYSPTSV